MFNAKELDEESGMYYYEARYYNPPTFISRDPHFEKYPTFSPYAYCYNNPVNVIDPTGKDGIVTVNEETQTLTVTAVYFVQTVPYEGRPNSAYTSEEVAAMEQTINGILNNANHKVTEGEYAGYSVQFNLKFRDGGDAISMENSANNEKHDGIPIGNTFQKGDEKLYKQFIPTSEGVVGGFVSDYNRVAMNEKHDGSRNRIHELFHTFFFNRDNELYGIGSYLRFDRPNQDDINILINNPRLPKVKSQ
jgi:RHS repeat-associated protein